MGLTEEQFQQVCEAFICDDSFSDSFETFAQENCDVFDSDSEEQKLEYTEVYKKFQELFDVKIAELLASKGVSTDDFYNACKEAVATGDSDREEFMKMLLAITDYDMFLTTMREEKLKKDREVAA
uniref:Cilia- and flagella-associated protein 36 n=1 Tax=Tetraselmis chuii TaxID=63592 RepID=A0A7S1ST38_9CHLO|mmetsp:Transcript_27612/g.49240  ORF Transcript_27612/g.49240 Transcript_27612/m.49240 type:complete len:125 (+) Transcript_27612:121-495(+)|eukprot:CAMPEP_0177763612 /NCGR_PEP_ID=MMETSP0491_2-20121128/6962_1 /TAXON_ID=63592 /ORGANISM="Tetraselmis chuii, Strain PLY429" /LENGTH=124 /DNA_ID=CAMNT_0019279727 /DNA_START=121 /DNA_END=495 /DNA_ORIENTATION=+